MAKRIPLKLEREAPRTGAEALALVTGASPPERAPSPAPRRTEELVPVLVRMTKGQKRALSEEAFRRAQERGSSKLDSSEVLREILDAWVTRR